MYLDTHYCKIWYEQEIKSAAIKWFGSPKSEKFREACMLVIDVLKNHNSHKVLTDNSNAVIFSRTDQRWLNEEWLPLAEKAGYRVSATVIKDDPFVKFAVSNIVKERDKKFTTKSFSSQQEAKEWLKSL